MSTGPRASSSSPQSVVVIRSPPPTSIGRYGTHAEWVQAGHVAWKRARAPSRRSAPVERRTLPAQQQQQQQQPEPKTPRSSSLPLRAARKRPIITILASEDEEEQLVVDLLDSSDDSSSSSSSSSWSGSFRWAAARDPGSARNNKILLRSPTRGATTRTPRALSSASSSNTPTTLTTREDQRRLRPRRFKRSRVSTPSKTEAAAAAAAAAADTSPEAPTPRVAPIMTTTMTAAIASPSATAPLTDFLYGGGDDLLNRPAKGVTKALFQAPAITQAPAIEAGTMAKKRKAAFGMTLDCSRTIPTARNGNGPPSISTPTHLSNLLPGAVQFHVGAHPPQYLALVEGGCTAAMSPSEFCQSLLLEGQLEVFPQDGRMEELPLHVVLRPGAWTATLISTFTTASGPGPSSGEPARAHNQAGTVRAEPPEVLTACSAAGMGSCRHRPQDWNDKRLLLRQESATAISGPIPDRQVDRGHHGATDMPSCWPPGWTASTLYPRPSTASSSQDLDDDDDDHHRADEGFVGCLALMAFDGFANNSERQESSPKLTRQILAASRAAYQKQMQKPPQPAVSRTDHGSGDQGPTSRVAPDLFSISPIERTLHLDMGATPPDHELHVSGGVGLIGCFPGHCKPYKIIAVVDEVNQELVAIDVVFPKTNRWSFGSTSSAPSHAPLTRQNLDQHEYYSGWRDEESSTTKIDAKDRHGPVEQQNAEQSDHPFLNKPDEPDDPVFNKADDLDVNFVLDDEPILLEMQSPKAGPVRNLLDEKPEAGTGIDSRTQQVHKEVKEKEVSTVSPTPRPERRVPPSDLMTPKLPFTQETTIDWSAEQRALPINELGDEISHALDLLHRHINPAPCSESPEKTAEKSSLEMQDEVSGDLLEPIPFIDSPVNLFPDLSLGKEVVNAVAIAGQPSGQAQQCLTSPEAPTTFVSTSASQVKTKSVFEMLETRQGKRKSFLPTLIALIENLLKWLLPMVAPILVWLGAWAYYHHYCVESELDRVPKIFG